ncbi:hypothetical protein [Nocardia sp. CY41]|uniref:hypothetical protein n=1 Tax=Nocardia sp. CY41 TaxID=2608686 RepID=UPI00135B2FED|nr:hypothetical protein [Nocardia sp. CY41]
MSRFSALLVRAAERIGVSAHKAVRVYSGRTGETTGGIRLAVWKHSAADGEGRRSIAAAGTDLMLSGTTAKGKPVLFQPTNVKSVALKDANGETIGVMFPSKPSDDTSGKWASAPTRNVDTTVTRGFVDVEKARVTKQLAFIAEEPETAPWAQTTTPKRPVYAQAHADPEVFVVKANLGSRLLPRWTTVDVDGETYGKILATNEHFARAAGASPGAPVVLVSCDVGDGAMVARTTADYLHRTGAVTGDIYAPKGMTGFSIENGVSDMYVTLLKLRGDGTAPGFEVFPGPGADTAG